MALMECSRRPWHRTHWFWQYLFSDRQWYRRWVGGHWELWWNDITCSFMWLNFDRCSHAGSYRYRPGGCVGSTRCEDYPAPLAESAPPAG